MTDPQTLRALAAELCEAKEGSPNLDARIGQALGIEIPHNVVHLEYSTSLDAALPGEDIAAVHAPGMMQDRDNHLWRASCWISPVGGALHPRIAARAHTEPLARRAAALLAMAERMERSKAKQDADAKAHARQERLRERAKALKSGGMRCNCDLDNWEPEKSTGHSWVCRIHKAAIEAER